MLEMDMPFGGYTEEPFEVQIPGHPHPHQVRIWLPGSYHHGTQRYPTLWVTDNLLEHAQAALTGSHFTDAPELIVVAVGQPRGVRTVDYGHRRIYDFLPTPDLLTMDDSAIEAMREVPPGGAEAFLDHLTGPLRDRVSETYRTDGDHGLAGHSGGAMFALYCLFSRPDAFGKYLIGSPAAGVDYARLESAHHAASGALRARVFLAAGGAEMTTPSTARSHIVSTTATVCELLVTREYEGLELRAEVIPDSTHAGVLPTLFAEGLRWLWRDQELTVEGPAARTAEPSRGAPAQPGRTA